MEVARYAKHSQLSPEREFYNERENQHEKKIAGYDDGNRHGNDAVADKRIGGDGVGEPSETNSGAVFSKTVHQENNGDVKITLEAWATGQTVQTTKQQPLDIVLVLDQSGSMANNFDKKTSRQAAMKNAVNGFIDKVAKNYTEGAAHRISIVTFGSEAKVLQNWTKVDANGTDDLKNKVSGLPETPAGATNVAEGMTKAQTQLSNAQKDHKKVVVVFTDGVPTTHSDFSTKVATNAIETAKALKDNQTEIYTIGIFNGVNANQLYGEKWAYLFYKDVPCTGEVGSYWGGSSAASLFGGNDFADIDVAAGNRFLNYLSSNFAEVTSIGVERGRYDPSNTLVDGTGYKITQNFDRFSSDYYLTATDSASLNNVFTQISQNINSAVNEKLDTTAVVKDTMTEYFNLPDNTTGIKVYTQNRQADGNWADRVETTDTTVKIDGQTVTVTGYDYATNFVSETAKADGSYGQKLVIEFTITPDLAKLAQDEAVKVDTNTGAGLYLGETAVATGESGKASFCGVKYDANGGTGTVPATQIGANGTKFTVPASCNTLKKDKAVLLGFSATKRDALVTNESDAADVVTEYAPAKDTLAPLYAVWAEDKNGNGTPDYKEKKYTITYAAGTEDTTVSGMPDAVTDVLANTEQTVSTVKPTREGYTFSGWTTTDVEVKDDKTFTMPKNNVTFTAQWTANDVTITFNANGGEWAENANVDDYTLIDNNTKASKTYQPSEAVAKIATDPVWNGHIFNGWYVKIPGKTGEEPEKYFITVWDATLQAQRIQEYGGVIYADWDDAAQPTEKLNYTTRQHYINEKGVEKLAVNITVQSAEKGTEISKLIQHLETDQTYYGQKYLYDDTKTTVNGVAYAKTMTLDTKGTAIDLYYYLDEWNDENDKVTGGDGTPDCQQAVVNFLADPNGSVGKDSEKPTQVFTLKKGKDGKYSEYVTPANVTPMPKENFVFDIWTKDNGETGVNPFVAQTLNGGDKVTYTAHFAADKIGSENKPDGIPDKYQAVVTYKVVGGTWKDGKTDAQVQVFTLKTKNEKTGVWEDANPVLGNTIPTGMISSYSRTASQSWDKDITKDTKVTESVTYTYTFTQGSSGGGGGSSTHYYISLKKVDAQDGEALSGAKFGLYLDGKQIATATSDRNGIVRFSMGSSNYRSLTDKSNLYCQELTAPEGYKLSNEKIAVSKKDVSTSSSTSDKNAKTVKNSRSKTPSMLNGKDHFAYIVGYPDKTVHPQSSITRAEVATIFFRLLTEETRTANATKTNKYADVSSDKWYNQAVSTLSAMGIIKGDSRGNFNPNAPITRAEFAAIAARFDKTEDVAAASFGDVAMHWAKPEISVAANNGWINGYTDGTFHPDSKITRAEAMAMINRVLQRLPESKADLLDGMIQWSDNADTSKWYYLAVQEATNSHYYELKANQHEKWTKLRENRDWTQLEK